MWAQEQAAEYFTQWREWIARARREPIAVDPQYVLTPEHAERRASVLNSAQRTLDRLHGHLDPLGAAGDLPGSNGPLAARLAREQRDDFLRAGVWGALGAWRAAAVAAGVDASGLGLIRALARAGEQVPALLEGEPGFFACEGGQQFLANTLRPLGASLARLYDDLGCNFGLLLGEADRLSGGPSTEAWSRLWSQACCALYIEYAGREGMVRLTQLQAQLWVDAKRPGTAQFKPPRGLAALPTANAALKVVLWAPLPVAQVLAYSPSRWSEPASSDGLHALDMRPHRLGTSSDSDGSPQPTGLVIGLIYQAALIGMLGALTRRLDSGLAAMTMGGDELASLLPGTAHGHRLAVARLLLWMQEQGFGWSDPVRRTGHADEPQSGGARSEAVARLAAAADAGSQWLDDIDTDLLSWRPTPGPTASEPATPDEPVSLGSGAIWDALGPEVQWLDVLLLAPGGIGPITAWFESNDTGRADFFVDGEVADALWASADERLMFVRALGQSERSKWLVRRHGTGAFIAVGVLPEARSVE